MKTSIHFTILLILAFSSAEIKICQTNDSTVTDFDGNIYNAITIGNQTWLKENIKSIHYSDGTVIPDAVSYDNISTNADIYGRLYTWDAAMNNSTEESAQGVCPCGWHIPSHAEWKILENNLGGAIVAGGKMKHEGMQFWKIPNTGANNSSGLTILPGGEYDANITPNKFNLLKEYAVFWTSTEVSVTKARERYLAYNDAKSSVYDWYKVMKYSIRCVQDSIATTVNNTDIKNISTFTLHQNYPNPFNPSTTINFSIPQNSFIRLQIFDVNGRHINTLVESKKSIGYYSITWDGKNEIGNDVSSGMYFYRLMTSKFTVSKKMVLVR
jgi:uncharacterized protein (TIGR02145 family)